MIVRILATGASFKGLTNYLTHDPKAQTDERVAWTHTLNLANDHVPSAVDEMVWTARDAELLKQEAGIRAGGRETENAVKHLSLNWSPDESPTREHMLQTTEDFLRHMQWQDHQAVIVAHDDKAYAHAHIMLNMIHPETGLRLNDDFERRRAQAWALDYEKENGLVYCGQRLKRPGEREDAPTRDAWMAFEENKKQFERVENNLRENANLSQRDGENPQNPYAAEWKMLKEIQRGEREGFFADGKSAFSNLRTSIYQENRADFRDRWSDYFTARREGGDSEQLAAIKADLLKEQKGALEARRDAACAELRESRDGIYQQLLGGQQETRHQLHAYQEAGLDNTAFLAQLRDHDLGFRDAATEIGVWQESSAAAEVNTVPSDDAAEVAMPVADVGTHAATSIGAGAFSLVTGWMVELNYGNWERETRAQQTSSLFDAAAAEAQQRQQREAREEADRDWRERERTRSWD